MYHWSERLDEIARIPEAERASEEPTYAKVLAQRGRRIVGIAATRADLVEFEAECANWLDTETDVSIGADADDRRIRTGYRTLRTRVAAASKALNDAEPV